MDTSETYIKMCEKAEEIQVLWEHKEGDFFCSRFERDVFKYNNPIHIWKYGFTAYADTWLPRQDQLQELSSLSWYSLDGACEDFSEAPTKEQAGIQVAMKEKYNKVWNGEGWG